MNGGDNMKEYSKKEQYKILAQSAILVNGESTFRIDYVPEYELWESGDEDILMTDEYDGCEVSFGFNHIDLNDPSVNTYKLVLSNPFVE
jgi:hypothetical protein